MKKWLVPVLVLMLVFTLSACEMESVVLEHAKVYEISADIHSLDIQINAADFIIEQGSGFELESNLKNLTVSEKCGVLIIKEKIVPGVDYTNAMLTLRVPENIVLDKVEIETGAANLMAESLCAKDLTLKLGAGNVEFAQLIAYDEIDIEGGAGQITVKDGDLKDLSLSLGVGRLDLTAALQGKCELEFGVGESNVTVLGDRNDYIVDIEKGIGSVTLDGDGKNSSEAKHYIQIKGGIGSANVSFQEEKEI